MLRRNSIAAPIAVLALACFASAAVPAHAYSMCEDSNDGKKSKPCWEVGLIWSGRDQGAVEPNIQKEWQAIDVAWPGTNLYHTCIEVPTMSPGRAPGGRACAMRFAAEAARHGFDDKAWRIRSF